MEEQLARRNRFPSHWHLSFCPGNSCPGKSWGPPSLGAPKGHTPTQPDFGKPHPKLWGRLTHRDILRLQGLNALGNVAIVNVAAIHFHEVAQGSRLVSRDFVG